LPKVSADAISIPASAGDTRERSEPALTIDRGRAAARMVGWGGVQREWGVCLMRWALWEVPSPSPPLR
jgi:hypothetical protein